MARLFISKPLKRGLVFYQKQSRLADITARSNNIGKP